MPLWYPGVQRKGSGVGGAASGIVRGVITDNSGSATTVQDDTTWNEFPGMIRLDATHLLVVYRGNATNHANNGQICGQILTLNAGNTSVTSVGTKFTILDDVEDLRCEDPVSIVDGQIVVAFRYFDGSDNHDPSIIVCNDLPAAFTTSSTWGSPIALPDPGGTVQKYTQGNVKKLADNTYILGGGYDSGGDHSVGLWRWTTSIANATSASFVTVISGANDHSEITLGTLSTGALLALLRSDNLGNIRYSTSSDSGATWTFHGTAYDGHGNPMFRVLTSGIVLTVYRDAPNGDTAWRYSTTDASSWSSETILDTNGTRSAYATLYQTTNTDILCVYGVEYHSGGASGTADLFYQWFADSSTFP